MYKWHVHSAIGRGRPMGHDFARVADGIATTLRQFSVSVSRAAQDEDKPTITRTERSANAAKEVSSLARREAPRGVDARSLAAKPTQGFTITRFLTDAPIRSGSSGQRDRAPSPRGGARGRGNFAVRAGRGARGGRGRGKGGPRRKKTAFGEGQQDVYPPLEKEEQAWFDGFESGFEIPYNPSTNLDHLKRSAASVMPPSSAMGAVESVAHRFQIATSMVSAHDTHSALHLAKIRYGEGSMFETPEAKAVAQAYYDKFRQENADKAADREGRERKKVEPRALRTMDSLPEDARSELAKALIGGHYVGPKYADKENILGLADAYARINETYLPHSKKKLEEKLKTLLPAAYLKQQPENAPGRKQGQKPL